MSIDLWNRISLMTGKSFTKTATICLISTIIVAAGLTLMNPTNWISYVIISFVFSFCIGIPIALLLNIFSVQLNQLSRASKIGTSIVLFVIGGSVGTAIGMLIMNIHFNTVDLIRLVLFNLLLSVIVGGIAFVHFSLQEKAKRMAVELKEKEIHESKLLQLKTKAELDALQTKVNPHFLFNTLNSIASMISESPAAAESMVENLAELFRYTLESTEHTTVKLAEELEIIRLYLQIEKIRFGNRLEFEIITDDRLNDFEIPALLIQPLVENAIKHAIAIDVAGGMIRVETKLASGECHITVIDSGKEFTTDGCETGFGLKSIRERLHLLYGDSAHLTVDHAECTHILISIPFL